MFTLFQLVRGLHVDRFHQKEVLIGSVWKCGWLHQMTPEEV